MKHILLTGASRGVGLALAQLHLEKGDQVHALLRTTNHTAEQLKQQFPNLNLYFCDMRSESDIRQVFRNFALTTDHLDLLYNVAGINLDGDGIPLTELNFQNCLDMYNVNALGPLRVLSSALPFLKETSVVLNITSEAGSITECKRTDSYGYCMSKAAANMATKMFSNAFPYIRTFCVHPGWVRTDMGGPHAKNSPYSISPRESAEALYDIAVHPQQFSDEVIYLDYKNQAMPW